MCRIKLRNLKHYLVVIGWILSLTRCVSQPENAAQPVKPKVPGVLEEVNNETSDSSKVPNSSNLLVSNLSEKLAALGYEALGLAFEEDDTLLLLGKVFDSPVAQNRNIKIIYTGLMMSYDPVYQSLTINTTQDLGSILRFIDKKVPKRTPDVTVTPQPDSSLSSDAVGSPISPETANEKPIEPLPKKIKKLKNSPKSKASIKSKNSVKGKLKKTNAKKGSAPKVIVPTTTNPPPSTTVPVVPSSTQPPSSEPSSSTTTTVPSQESSPEEEISKPSSEPHRPESMPEEPNSENAPNNQEEQPSSESGEL